MRNKGIFSVLIFLGFLVFASGSIDDDRTPEQIAEDNCKDTTIAFVMSQGFVKQKLKSPSTAEFPYISNDGVRVEYQEECKHNVWAYVDSQNTFGAVLRSKYYAEVQNEKGTETWELLDMQIYE